MELICEYLLKNEIKMLNEKEKLTNQEECWLESCERELILIKQLQLNNISYYGCKRNEFVEKIENYTVKL